MLIKWHAQLGGFPFELVLYNWGIFQTMDMVAEGMHVLQLHAIVLSKLVKCLRAENDCWIALYNQNYSYHLTTYI